MWAWTQTSSGISGLVSQNVCYTRVQTDQRPEVRLQGPCAHLALHMFPATSQRDTKPFVTLPGRTGIVWILTMVKATQAGRMGKRLQCIYISTFILQMGKLRSKGDLDLPKIKGKDLAGRGGADKECKTQASGPRQIQRTSLTVRYRGFHQIHLSHSC